MPTKAETVTALSRPTVGEGQHPLESTRYILPTPQVEEMCAQVVHWVRLRNPGAIIHAPPRHGKSRGLEILRRDLNESFPGMPVLLLPAWDYTQPKEKSFFSDLLTASGHVLNKSGSADDMRDRLVHFLAEQGTYNGHGRVLLIVDEAQNLHPRHYNWLIGVHNMLSLREVNFIVLLVGQQELLAQRAAFVKADKKQIVGRFMIHAQAFHGVRSTAKPCIGTPVVQFASDSWRPFLRCPGPQGGDAEDPSEKEWGFLPKSDKEWSLLRLCPTKSGLCFAFARERASFASSRGVVFLSGPRGNSRNE